MNLSVAGGAGPTRSDQHLRRVRACFIYVDLR
jgi:hypothetical protein